MRDARFSDTLSIQGGSNMKNIVVSMQNTLLSEAIAHALTETREFRVEQILPGRATRSPCAPPCRRISC